MPFRYYIVATIELGALLSSIYFCLQWLLDPQDFQEPIIALISLIIFGLLEFYRRHEGYLFKSEYKKLTPSELVQHSEKLRKPLHDEILKCRHDKLRKDAVIRHVNRLGEYPDSKNKKKGISAWFKVGLLEMYHEGIMVGLNYKALKEENGKYRYCNYGSETEDVTAVLIGEIPFSAIDDINIEGDEYYPYPHIFCRFPYKGEPYKNLYFCEEIMMHHGHPYYKKIADYTEVKLNSQKAGIK